MSAESLAKYVNANTASAEFVASCWAEAEVMVSGYVGLHTVPPVILDRAILEVGAELYNRKSAPSGVQQFGTPDGSTGVIRIARDPMQAAYAILRPYVGWGIA